MPSPIRPSDFKELIPDVDGNLCDKFVGFLREFPKKFYLWFSSVYTEEGDFTEEFKADLCAACPCGTTGGTGTGTGGTLAVPVISASDGAFNDRVRITWSPVASATIYDVYRNSVNSTNGATLLTSISTEIYDDTSAASGQVYYYWVTARNTTSISAFSVPDTGYASVVLVPIANLMASRGLMTQAAQPIHAVALVWEPVAGANAYDIYRNDTDDFDTAVLIDANRAPFDNSESYYPCPTTPCAGNIFSDRGDELFYQDATVPTFTGTYYYWVKAKKLNGSQVVGVSNESNTGTGWAMGRGNSATYLNTFALDVVTSSYTIEAGTVQLWIGTRGGGAAGGGGNGSIGGGGGGGSAIVAGLLNVQAGRRIRYVSTPVLQAEGYALADGDDGPVVKIQYETGIGSGLYTDIITLTAPTGGEYNPGNAGLGGTYSIHASLLESWAENGRDGEPAVGSKGGRGGATFDNIRPAGNILNHDAIKFDGINGAGFSGTGGGGAWSHPSAVLAKGAPSATGYAAIVTYGET